MKYNYTRPVNNTIGLYGEFALGANFSKITNYAAEVDDEEESTTFDPAFTFCWGLEAGVFINKK